MTRSETWTQCSQELVQSRLCTPYGPAGTECAEAEEASAAVASGEGTGWKVCKIRDGPGSGLLEFMQLNSWAGIPPDLAAVAQVGYYVAVVEFRPCLVWGQSLIRQSKAR